MPAKSLAQLRWINSSSGHKALGESGVKEWDQASKGLKLPDKVGKLHAQRMSKKP
jgi:hypothetical protein